MKIDIMNLPSRAFTRPDDSPDEIFYRTPRLVTHIDDAAVDAVTQVYRDVLPRDGAILDLMSSHVSHLPPEIEYSRVVGLGMNRDELAANARLQHFVVQNLNEIQKLPFIDNEFDAATICVSVQYLQKPIEVLRELRRVCRQNAPVVITFSNRCFPTKAVAIWQALDDKGHAQLVQSYLETAGWRAVRVLELCPSHSGDPLIALVATKP